MFMALASLMTDRTVRSDTAMTGEISRVAWSYRSVGSKKKLVIRSIEAEVAQE
jgi:ATP-dependent Lon protease